MLRTLICFYIICMAGCVCSFYLGNILQRDGFEEDGKLIARGNGILLGTYSEYFASIYKRLYICNSSLKPGEGSSFSNLLVGRRLCLPAHNKCTLSSVLPNYNSISWKNSRSNYSCLVFYCELFYKGLLSPQKCAECASIYHAMHL